MALEPIGAKHPLVGELRRLARRRRQRVAQGQFLVEGPLLVEAALAAGTSVDLVVHDGAVALDASTLDLLDQAAATGARVVELAPGGMARVADAVTPQPVLAVCRRQVADLEQVVAQAVSSGLPLVVLADVADPGNAGTLLRSAEAAGCAGVVCCGGVDPFGPKTVRASAGAVFTLAVVEDTNLRLVLARLGDAGLARIGLAAHHGEALDGCDLAGPVALVLGSESHGLPDGLDRSLDQLITIPTEGRAESLNVAMAGTVALFEASRQRRRAG